jgi:predicted dehydrogenase
VYRELRKVLAEGLIGRLLTARAWHQCFRSAAYYEADAWRGKWASEGGSLLINQSIHFIDILQWLAGGVDSVSAAVANHCHDGVIETEDGASLQFTFRNGALGSFIATSASHMHWSYGFHFAGTDGDVEIREGRLYHCSHRDAAIGEHISTRLGAVRDGDGVSAAKDYYGSGHPAQLKDFVTAIREGRAPEVSIADAAVANRIVLAAYSAAQQGRRIAL